MIPLPLSRPTFETDLSAGQRLARGAARLLRSHDFLALEEVPLKGGLRADLLALGPGGEIWIVECKSCRADFRADRKWQGYLEHCDRFFWAVDPGFPAAILPEDSGLILADAWGGEILRMAPETPLAAARRKALTREVARLAMARLMALRDPAV